jgi:hypothetical protein
MLQLGFLLALTQGFEHLHHLRLDLLAGLDVVRKHGVLPVRDLSEAIAAVPRSAEARGQRLDINLGEEWGGGRCTEPVHLACARLAKTLARSAGGVDERLLQPVGRGWRGG